jgi:hypothetical protein
MFLGIVALRPMVAVRQVRDCGDLQFQAARKLMRAANSRKPLMPLFALLRVASSILFLFVYLENKIRKYLVCSYNPFISFVIYPFREVLIVPDHNLRYATKHLLLKKL